MPHSTVIVPRKENFKHKISLQILTLIYVVVQFYPWFKFYFLMFLGMVMYDNEFETKENKI